MRRFWRAIMKFEELNLAPAILQAVQEQGYDTPTPVQAQAIPIVLAGQDLLAGAQTGTGKTAAFMLPILHKLSLAEAGRNKFGGKAIRALVLTPTRELAAQIQESAKDYGKYLSLQSTVVFGGVGMKPQVDPVKRGVDVLVATPGRLLDLQGQGLLDLSSIEILVLDEADRMLDMGFIHDVKKILALVPKDKQSLLFSATFSDEIRDLAATLKEPTEHSSHAQQHHGATHLSSHSPSGSWQEERSVGAHHQPAQLESSFGVHSHQVWREQCGRLPDQKRHQVHGIAWQQEPNCSHPGLG